MTLFETTEGAEVYTWWHHHTIQNVAILWIYTAQNHEVSLLR